MTHRFTIILTPGNVVAAAVPGSVVSLAFDRAADSTGDAVAAAVTDLERAGLHVASVDISPLAKIARITDLKEPLTPAEVDRLRETINGWCEGLKRLETIVERIKPTDKPT